MEGTTMIIITLMHASKFLQDSKVRRARLAEWREGYSTCGACPVLESTL